MFGSGAGLVALRRLDDAREAADPVLAIVRSSAVNPRTQGKRKEPGGETWLLRKGSRA
jgi:acyl transferase domain-containing protein